MTINISPPCTSGTYGMCMSFTEFSQASNTWWILVWTHTWWQHDPLNLWTLHGLVHCLHIFFLLKSLFLISCCCCHHCYCPIHIHIFVLFSLPFLFLHLFFWSTPFPLFPWSSFFFFTSSNRRVKVRLLYDFCLLYIYIYIHICNICLAISSLLVFLVHTFSLGKRRVKVRPT